ncbi:MAG: 4-aminobutyrate--2-oxoglutarate transaminase [Bradyrhizobium sp.]|jgi:4-aminobutyrate aminotransferase/(S)-3-amino-2-methylpropionate transaminase|uniref:4-aminobutyrate--2-oxoglutarate transaminase n=3 Tax=Bradyrhizobium TaxID=374 RepID=A0ABS5G6A6_9BRAD|nr:MULTISPECIES: 4-aminobutyrate--2-oxoglutarate transaminase [Bradyrhizobium]RTM05735.1 MAG: 4-aminobutyrate--2-oxoglutarate transaminase [Bradyrhizobiaceae bacterium]ABQ36337.1 4-aminobutyrate aminotransferase apoenzyme [Bradyrhizobium sp. BTAi1]MBR1136793.1 4-aminobutyrate--2-oxoglutarate transaminase [Bradyrhizobium denitrificans]MCL8487592.1 4-aminobutyrate--2-oxoglutarate transaminase [Bradyrhizobium denitrificans]MDU1493003.1 4-aminobutyrate--2-oxoglutarate transaminase [Bradyrhizobium 
MGANEELLARRHQAVVRGVSYATPLFADRALNSEVWDVEGKRYVDFAGGIAVLNTGHCHPHVVAAIRAQLDRFTHTCFQVLQYEPYVRLTERLNAIAPISGPAKSILLTTGAEATENAIKIARAATGRSGIIAFTGAFHGRTALANAMTGKVMPYKKHFGPPLPGIWHAPFPIAGSGVSVEDTLSYINFIFKADIDASQVAAIIIEPVQGEGGFHQAPPELMSGLRRLCDTHGIVLIADEVQTGFGRTGKMFAMEHYDVQPDVICVAKSLAGGMPLSGVIGRAAIMDAAEPGGLGGTYGGNPLACAAALAVLDVFEQDKLLDRANAIGARLRAAISKFSRANTLVPISEPRGPGAMIAFDILKQRGSHEPDAEMTKRVTRVAYENGLILLSCGVTASTIRILVPLTASDEIVDEGLAILEKCLAA